MKTRESRRLIGIGDDMKKIFVVVLTIVLWGCALGATCPFDENSGYSTEIKDWTAEELAAAQEAGVQAGREAALKINEVQQGTIARHDRLIEAVNLTTGD